MTTTTAGAGTPGYLRMRQLRQRLPIAPSTIWAWVAADKFPRPVQLGERVTAWRLADIEVWERSRCQSTAA